MMGRPEGQDTVSLACVIGPWVRERDEVADL